MVNFLGSGDALVQGGHNEPSDSVTLSGSMAGFSLCLLHFSHFDGIQKSNVFVETETVQSGQFFGIR